MYPDFEPKIITLTPETCLLRGEAANTNYLVLFDRQGLVLLLNDAFLEEKQQLLAFLIFGLTRPGTTLYQIFISHVYDISLRKVGRYQMGN